MTEPEGAVSGAGPGRGKRSTFGPVVLLGLASAALAAVSGAKAWYVLPDAAEALDIPIASNEQFALDMPLAGALSLVLLASWGVVLVTRGWVRRAVAGLALASSLGLAVTVVQGARTLPDSLQDRLKEAGVATPVDSLDAGLTGWFWAAAVATLLSVVAAAVAVRDVPSWPTMGSRYDAPGAAKSGPVDVERARESDLWKAIDEGHDPTL
ncbi:Trp biosynthesis-associated membrane protein [Nocardioides sp. JQ2195]|uniref:Trp biosynthesis-associated membrane protein n=1 Tax=Nocardioides sp. JQ2195 TaxID=2592334 RepID=UPI00143E2D04|nr:Trp biosynthesis-associated membrane protein [Nocardioides sp. JQ2195]QIX26390.1 Trp biosynthesis-associated membrane protein [Nocardioides sp. JQ2195]